MLTAAWAALAAALFVLSPSVGAGAAALPVLAYAALSGLRHIPRSVFLPGTALVALMIVAEPWANSTVQALGAANLTSPTGALKAAVSAAAVAGAVVLRVRGRWLSFPATLIAAYGVVTVAGGIEGAALHSAVLRMVRLVLIVAACDVVASRIGVRRTIRLVAAFSVAICATSAVGYLAGVSPLIDRRLSGYPLPLAANEIGLLAAAGLISLIAVAPPRGRRWLLAAPALLLLFALALSGSRTSWGGFAVALVAYAIRSRSRVWLGTISAVTVALALLAIFGAVTGHDAIRQALTRQGETSISLSGNGRAAEWHAALAANRGFEVLTGQGLQAKTVFIEVPFPQDAPVDGSWHAAYLSGGLLGVLLLLVAVCAALGSAWRNREPAVGALVLFLVASSVLTNVINDLSVGLVILVAMTAAGRQRARPSSASAVRAREASPASSAA
ncbi:MAG TPA: O-antigen ligase family protein [Gaiellaceae bacterium]|nr:O-antigen ligase family protein [Gaiellaceae bacterium]